MKRLNLWINLIYGISGMSLIDVIQVMILHNFKSFRNDGCARRLMPVFVDVQDVND
jgi:hypothetical protein